MPANDSTPAPSKPLDLKYWWCGGRTGCGHIVGHISHHDMQNSGKVKTLVIYEQSLDTAPSEIQPVRGEVTAGFHLQCTRCANQYEWYPSLEALNRLLAHYQKDV